LADVVGDGGEDGVQGGVVEQEDEERRISDHFHHRFLTSSRLLCTVPLRSDLHRAKLTLKTGLLASTATAPDAAEIATRATAWDPRIVACVGV
jgi:hypothetical protein